jgi:hypothetical protein
MRTFNLHKQKPIMKPTHYNAPSVSRLRDALGLTKEQAETVRGLIRGEVRTIDNPAFPSTAAWINSCYNRPSRVERIMACINEVLQGYGCEAIWGDDPYWPAVEYVNMGDTYTPTICFLRDADRFVLSCWGDIVEKQEALQ